MKLRDSLLLAIVVLIGAIAAAIVIAVGMVVENAERRDLRDDLARSQRVFSDLLAYRSTTLGAECHVVANEPRLRALVATQDISRDTVVGVIGELSVSHGSDVFVLTDAAGTVVADAHDPQADGSDLHTQPLIAASLVKGDGDGILVFAGRAFQGHACRIDFGAQLAGILMIGRVFDDSFANIVDRQTDSALVITLDGKPIAKSRPRDDGEYETVGGGVPGYTGKRLLAYELSQSVDAALAPGRRLRRTVLVVALGALLAGMAIAFVLSRWLSRPVGELVAFTRAVAKGDTSRRAQPSGAVEVRALANAMNDMVGELEKSREQLAEKSRLESELQIATRIQTSILPKSFDVPGLDIAARMIPATEVGGDYYDVLPMDGCCWIGIGDVAGHGLTAGLQMLMVQSVVAALVRENPSATPKGHLRVLNHVLYENVRQRLGQDEHITMTLLRFDGEAVVFAGAHEEIVVCRASGGACDRISTPGPWLGAARDLRGTLTDSTLSLATGDVMLLYTDGITEARSATGGQFGMDRLCEVVESSRTETVEVIRDRVVAAVQAFQSRQEDDISLVVVRRVS